ERLGSDHLVAGSRPAAAVLTLPMVCLYRSRAVAPPSYVILESFPREQQRSRRRSRLRIVSVEAIARQRTRKRDKAYGSAPALCKPAVARRSTSQGQSAFQCTVLLAHLRVPWSFRLLPLSDRRFQLGSRPRTDREQQQIRFVFCDGLRPYLNVKCA